MFKKYPSIENSYRDKFIEYIKTTVSKDAIWVVTEKIHGTNLSFIVNKEGINVAKRSSILSKDEKFYNAFDMLEKYKENFIAVYKSMERFVDGIQIYGEHFGGYYDGKSENKMIQKQVQYIPFTDFMVFDIRCYKGDKEWFVSWDRLVELSKQHHFKIVPELFRGTLEECLKYPNDFTTVIPSFYKLPEIDKNKAEGVVIKTLEDIRINKLGERAIIKNKNDKFKEQGKPKKLKKSLISLTEEDKAWCEIITRYFEKPRVDALFSKGDVKKDWKEFNKINGLFVQDVFNDFVKDFNSYQKLDKDSQKRIKKHIMKESANYLRKILKKEL